MRHGPGKRLGSKTKYFNKGLLRIGNQAAISHIIDYFNPEEHEFIIVTGHLGDIVKQYVTIAHPNIKVEFIEQENNIKGPGDALLQCKSLLDCPFYIWCADTLVDLWDKRKELPSVENNWIGFAETKSLDGEYSSVEINEHSGRIYDFHEKKSPKYTGNAYIGCAFVKDYEDFLFNLEHNPIIIDNQHQVSSGFQGLFRNTRVVFAERFRWFDIGDLDKLQTTKADPLFEAKIENLDKDDEELYFIGDNVIKYFYNSVISKNRVKRAKLLKGLVPDILGHSDNFYSYKFVEGVDLFDKSIVNLPNIIPNFLESMWKSELWKEKTLNPEEYMKFQNACVDFYYRKTKNRVDDLHKKLQNIDTETTINGETTAKLKDMLAILPWQKILNGKPCLMHGDMALSNIIKNGDDYSFIDWRQDFGGLTDFGDFYYDLAKLYATFLFPHDIIKQKRYKISAEGTKISFEIEKTEDDKYGQCQTNFIAWLTTKGIDVKKVRQLTAIVLLNMSPMHEYPLNMLLYYLGKETLWKTLKT